MGGGSYSSTLRTNRLKSTYSVDNVSDIKMRDAFKQTQINNAMNPYGVQLREARDSKEHPNSVAIILGLDVTGSMGSIPHFLVKEGLPNIMDKIIQNGVADPQVLFLGIGDHECDNSPLQVGQFESSDELLDKWLTDVYLEGGGGGNGGESYLLAWYFAAYRTATDCFEKRNKKGFLFTIGDEPVLERIPKGSLHDIMGDGQYEDFSANDLFEKASEKYNVFHIHVKETYSGSRQHVMDGWKQILHDNLIIAERKQDIDNLISTTILNFGGAQQITKSEDISNIAEESPVEEIL